MGEHGQADERVDGTEPERSSHDQPWLRIEALHARVRKLVSDRGVDAYLVLADGTGQLDERWQLGP